ncbi:MAG: DUF2878 domain-containing protein [Rhodanobacter sp.]
MRFWISLVGYQLVWFSAVIGAGHGHVWPGVLGWLLYASVQLALSRQPKADLALMATAILMGFMLDGVMARSGWGNYAAAWPSPTMAPAWILALWATFALTFTQSLAVLQTRPRIAALLGLIGGPLAYLSASRGWHAVTLAEPTWRGLAWLAAGWALATPALAWLARRWSHPNDMAPGMPGGLSS